ncbi:hypothetical protein N9I87_02745 [Gammaproteobacteria bacterium]|nr:hypothetical protein [Gammaproteobacteria bacterium]
MSRRQWFAVATKLGKADAFTDGDNIKIATLTAIRRLVRHSRH